MTQRYNQKNCFICGAGHSGSTLLGMILGSHSQTFYGGEMTKTQYLGQSHRPERKRVCKICGPDCPVWGDFVVQDGSDVYEQLSRKTTRPMIIDSAKDVAWLQSQTQVGQPYLIFLQRDGRAVINSRIRKYPERDAAEIIQKWRQQIIDTEQFFSTFNGPKLRLHYETLATEPEQTIEQVCDFLKIGYEPTMVRYYEQVHHPLGGNTGTQFLVAKAQAVAEPFVQLSARNEYYYTDHPLAIRLDLRWQQELQPHHQQLFEQLAGAVNQPMAYPFATQPDNESL